MGCGPFSGRTCGMYSDDTMKRCSKCENLPPSPNPLVFEILEAYQVGKHAVVKVKYPGCTNYEGIKICVYLYTKVKELCSRKELDPHFSENRRSPNARFEPTELGLVYAFHFAEGIDAYCDNQLQSAYSQFNWK